MFSRHNGVKLEISNGKKFGKPLNTEIKQHTLITPMGQKRNQKRNLKILGGEWKLTGCSESMLRGKFIALNAYGRKIKRANQ